MKRNKYTARIYECEDCFFGWIEEVPGTNCQEDTLKELKNSLFESISVMEEINEEDQKKKQMKWSMGARYNTPQDTYHTEYLTA